jgi:hypothetical protein
MAADRDRALLDGVDRQRIDRRSRRRSAQMFRRVLMAVRIAMPILVLVATTLVRDTGQRWPS